MEWIKNRSHVTYATFEINVVSRRLGCLNVEVGVMVLDLCPDLDLELIR